MPECTTTYEKLLEAQNEQLREKIEKLIAENDELSKKSATTQIQFNLMYKDVLEFFKRSKIHVVQHPAYRRRKAHTEAVLTSSWSPESGYNEERMPMLHPMLRQIWLDFLEGSVQGMKWAFKNDKGTGKPSTYTYSKKPDAKFHPTPEVDKP
jgi:hypothetical protein